MPVRSDDSPSLLLRLLQIGALLIAGYLVWSYFKPKPKANSDEAMCRLMLGGLESDPRVPPEAFGMALETCKEERARNRVGDRVAR